MADIFSLTRTLDDGAAGGAAAAKRIEGDASAAQNGSIGFAFKDSSGNVILPSLNSSGAIVVDTGGVAGTITSGHAILDSGSVTANSDNDVLTLVLALTTDYICAEFSVSASEQTTWSLVYIDDVGGTPTETVLWSGISADGNLTICCQPKNMIFNTQSGTGVQNLVMRGNPKKATDLHAFSSVSGS